MPTYTLVYGLLLLLLGIGGFVITGRESITALIPAFFGLPVLLFAWLARRETMRKHAMHAAAVLSLLAFLGTAGGVIQSARLLMGQDVERPPAQISKAVMALLSVWFLVLCIRSFIDARRNAAPPRPADAQ